MRMSPACAPALLPVPHVIIIVGLQGSGANAAGRGVDASAAYGLVAIVERSLSPEPRLELCLFVVVVGLLIQSLVLVPVQVWHDAVVPASVWRFGWRGQRGMPREVEVVVGFLGFVSIARSGRIFRARTRGRCP